MTKPVGTIGKAGDLDLQPGDVIECVNDGGDRWWTIGDTYDVGPHGIIDDDDGDTYRPPYGDVDIIDTTFRVVSRAQDAKADSPTILRDMTASEIIALVMADDRGKTVQIWDLTEWLDCDPEWDEEHAYRIKPEEPETVTIYAVSADLVLGVTLDRCDVDTHSITMPLHFQAGTYTSPEGHVIVVEELD